jgi:predicted small secreted protein
MRREKYFGTRIALLPLRTVVPARRLAGCGASYVEVMVGKLRAQIARAASARGTWITCSLLLASTLLGGCNHATTSGAGAQPTATAQPASVSTQTASPATQTSTPGPVVKAAKSVEVSWSAPTANTDGSALTNLAGYRVYYGTAPNTLNQSLDVPSAGANEFIVGGLQVGTWYFAVVAYTNTGLESTHSSVVSKSIT